MLVADRSPRDSDSQICTGRSVIAESEWSPRVLAELLLTQRDQIGAKIMFTQQTGGSAVDAALGAPRKRDWDAASRRELGAAPPRRSAAGPRGEVPGGAFGLVRPGPDIYSFRWFIRPCILNVRLSGCIWVKYHLNDPQTIVVRGLQLHRELPLQHSKNAIPLDQAAPADLPPQSAWPVRPR
jgi:hypothetical protein